MKYECKKLFLKVECLCEKFDKGKSPEEIAVELHMVKIKDWIKIKKSERVCTQISSQMSKYIYYVFQSPYSSSCTKFPLNLKSTKG